MNIVLEPLLSILGIIIEPLLAILVIVVPLGLAYVIVTWQPRNQRRENCDKMATTEIPKETQRNHNARLPK